MPESRPVVRRKDPRDHKHRVHGLEGCTSRKRFYCRSGKHWVCWCRGAADDMPDTCDWCWAKKHKEKV